MRRDVNAFELLHEELDQVGTATSQLKKACAGVQKCVEKVRDDYQLVFIVGDSITKGPAFLPGDAPDTPTKQLSHIDLTINLLAESAGVPIRAVPLPFYAREALTLIAMFGKAGDTVILQDAGAHWHSPDACFHAIMSLANGLLVTEGLNVVLTTTFCDATTPEHFRWDIPIRGRSMNDAIRDAARQLTTTQRCQLVDIEQRLSDIKLRSNVAGLDLLQRDRIHLTLQGSVLFSLALTQALSIPISLETLLKEIENAWGSFRQQATRPDLGYNRSELLPIYRDFLALEVAEKPPASGFFQRLISRARVSQTDSGIDGTPAKAANAEPKPVATTDVGATGIELLVTTFTNTLHVSLNGDTLEAYQIWPVLEGKGSYFGITWDTNRFYVLQRDYDSGPVPNEIAILDRDLNNVGLLRCGGSVREGHQIRIDRGTLYVCNTNFNCITMVDVQSGHTSHFYPVDSKRGRNFNHFNSIDIQGDRMRVLAANRFRNSFMLELTLPDLKIVEVDALGLAAHNLIDVPAGRIMCDSMHNSVVFWKTGYDDQRNELPLRSIFIYPDRPAVEVESFDISRLRAREGRAAPIMTRGLALTGDLLLVGLSEFSDRSERGTTPSRLMLIDGFSAACEGKVPSRVSVVDLGRHGVVMDVRVINRPDFGHALPKGMKSPRE